MKQWNISTLGGICFEMYEPEPERLRTEQVLVRCDDRLPDCLNLNDVFWTRLFHADSIDILLEKVCLAQAAAQEPYEFLIVNNPRHFAERIKTAKEEIFEQGADTQSFFSHIETLQIVCQLYSKYVSAPFQLTLYDGFRLDAASSHVLKRDCLVPARNPYYNFLEKYVWPLVLEEKPALVWLNGKMSHSNMAIALFLKRNLPQTKIFWACEASEYYAASKIAEYLLYNKPLFSVIDGAILHEMEGTRQKIVECLETGKIDLRHIGNLILGLKDSDGNLLDIIRTTDKRYHKERRRPIIDRRKSDKVKCDYVISPDKVANVRLFPYHNCFWGKCCFCGINKKYSAVICEKSKDSLWAVDEALESLLALQRDGVEYFWATDEAIPVETLSALAKGLKDNKANMFWQARTRISSKLLADGTMQLLADSGLRELRLGLETVSLRLLKMLNKIDDDFSLQLVEGIVKAAQDSGIAIHVPTMIGLPTETEVDRAELYQFLEYLHRHYTNFSFNINVFGLDISSTVFKEWESFGITSVRFPCNPSHFLGNILEWESDAKTWEEQILEEERDSVMREILYPWLPKEALIRPHILYRFLETTRNTLTMREHFPVVQENMELGKWHFNQQIFLFDDEKKKKIILYNISFHMTYIMNSDELPPEMKSGKALSRSDWKKVFELFYYLDGIEADCLFNELVSSEMLIKAECEL